jgi:hypothetical protein
VPAFFCYTDWEPAIVKEIIQRQGRINKKRDREGKPRRKHLIIVDDLASNKKFTKDPQLEELFMNCSHLSIDILVTLQDALKIHPALRNNIDWAFFFKEIMPNARKRLFEQYCGQFETQKQFERVFSNMTEDKGVMVLNNTGLSNNIAENYYFWKATPRDFNNDPTLPKWKIGSKSYWTFHYRYYDPKKDKDDSDDDDGHANIGEDKMVIMK